MSRKTQRFLLNDSQRRAVETIEGPVMVVAGPGTGKTQTLTARIAHILKRTDTPPDGILALTFTESGAGEMRQRLAEMIGPTAYYINIYTFHAFCSDVIQSHPDLFPSVLKLEPLSDLERVSIFRDIIDRTKLTATKPYGAPYLYVPSLIRAVSDLKREGIGSEDFKKLLASHAPTAPQEEKFYLRNHELARIYRRYERELVARGRYDFEDMITLVRDAFGKNQALLLDYQQRFLYILVDEYQDTNSAQNDLLFLLASYWGPHANIFVVGDDEQSIFRFQGASVENILSFRDAFPDATIISLTENYRSTQFILDAARAVVSHNKLSLREKLPQIRRKLRSTSLGRAKLLRIGLFSSGITEQFFIAKKIQELLKSGTPPREIAVMYRHNADGAEIAEFLSRMGIAYDLEGGKDVLTDPTIEKLLLLMKAVLGVRNNQEGVDLFTLVNYPFFGCDYVDTLKLSRHASERKMNLWDAMNPKITKMLDLRNPAAIARVYAMLPVLQVDDAEGPFVLFFEKLLNKTGFLDWCLRCPDSIEKLNRLHSLFSEIKRLNAADHTLNLESFLKTIELMRGERLSITEQDLDIRTNAVSLLTAHRAKGREFSVVFLARAVDKKWGNNVVRELLRFPKGMLAKTDISEKEKNEDERRLFYVALTRAKRELYITAAASYATQIGRRETSPTMFMYEIPKKFVQDVDTAVYEGGVKNILENLLTPVPDDSPSIREKDFLNKVIADFKLSPTALNTYLTCPYKFKLNNLLRSPRAKNSNMSFGTAIHTALQHFFHQYKKDGNMPDISILKKKFDDALFQEILSKPDHNRLLERGHAVLPQYVEYYRDDLVPPLFTERFFGYGWSKTYLGNIPLGGKVDKIDPFDSLTLAQGKIGRRVRVVDYKTGQPKSRSSIEGKLKNSTGDYKRQLVFYQLLGELDRQFEHEIVEAELDFVEPDRTTGKFRKERFQIQKEEVEELKKTIRKVWADMLALKFPRTTKTDIHCPRCEWNMHCWER